MWSDRLGVSGDRINRLFKQMKAVYLMMLPCHCDADVDYSHTSFAQARNLMLGFSCRRCTAVWRFEMTSITLFQNRGSVTHASWPSSSLLQPTRAGRFITDVTASSDYFTAPSANMCWVKSPGCVWLKGSLYFIRTATERWLNAYIVSRIEGGS